MHYIIVSPLFNGHPVLFWTGTEWSVYPYKTKRYATLEEAQAVRDRIRGGGRIDAVNN